MVRARGSRRCAASAPAHHPAVRGRRGLPGDRVYRRRQPRAPAAPTRCLLRRRCGSRATSPTRWPTRTNAGSSTPTSSPPTSCSIASGGRTSRTSGSRHSSMRASTGPRRGYARVHGARAATWRDHARDRSVRARPLADRDVGRRRHPARSRPRARRVAGGTAAPAARADRACHRDRPGPSVREHGRARASARDHRGRRARRATPVGWSAARRPDRLGGPRTRIA